jgi:PqqD family protein of HPr-rel-A system
LRWRTIPRQALAWHRFDEEIVVRNARTGSTHLLEPLSAQVFLALMEAGDDLSVEALQERLAGAEPGDNGTDEWRTAISAVLSEFQRLGLAESLPPSP